MRLRHEPRINAAKEFPETGALQMTSTSLCFLVLREPATEHLSTAAAAEQQAPNKKNFRRWGRVEGSGVRLHMASGAGVAGRGGRRCASMRR